MRGVRRFASSEQQHKKQEEATTPEWSFGLIPGRNPIKSPGPCPASLGQSVGAQPRLCVNPACRA